MKKLIGLFICGFAFSLFAEPVEKNDFKYNMNGWQKYIKKDSGCTITYDETRGRGDTPGAVVMKGTEKDTVSLGFHSKHCTERHNYQISVWVKGCDLAPDSIVRLISTPLSKSYKPVSCWKKTVLASFNATDLADGQWHKLSIQVDCSSVTEPINYLFSVIQFSGKGELLVDDYQAEKM